MCVYLGNHVNLEYIVYYVLRYDNVSISDQMPNIIKFLGNMRLQVYFYNVKITYTGLTYPNNNSIRLSANLAAKPLFKGPFCRRMPITFQISLS